MHSISDGSLSLISVIIKIRLGTLHLIYRFVYYSVLYLIRDSQFAY
jgi:hypothetical protein